MTPPPAQRAAQAATLALTFAVGMLVGSQFCAAPADDPVIEEPPDCPEPTIIETCSEPSTPPDIIPEDIPPPRRERTADREVLPDASPPTDPAARQQILAWIRDRSTTLQGCPRAGDQTYRMAITVDLDDDGAFLNPRLNIDDQQLPDGLQNCLIDRISQWTLPEDLTTNRQTLFFQLTL